MATTKPLSSLGVAFAVLLLAGAGCSGSATTAVTAPAAVPADTSASATIAPDAAGSAPTGDLNLNVSGSVAAQAFTVNASDESADLTAISVKKGTSVSITFNVSAAETYHGGLEFRSSVLNTGTIAPGGSKTVTFTADQSFEFDPYWPSSGVRKPYAVKVTVAQ